VSTDITQPALSVDSLVFRVTSRKTLEVLLAERWNEPYAGQKALPGVLLLPNESLSEAAIRAVTDKTQVAEDMITGTKQFRAFDDTNRDPRGLTISLVQHVFLAESDAATEGFWTPAAPLNNELPFDHGAIVQNAVNELQNPSSDLVRGILGNTFGAGDYAWLIEAAGGSIDRTNLTRVIPSRYEVERAGTAVSSLSGKRTTQWRFINE